ncbi:MAG: site-specific integrase [Gaiellaceae bacterium]
MPAKQNGKWGRVWRYEGPRGVSWRIRYQDASGRRVLETLGREPEWNRKLAEAELRRRVVDVERDGYVRPERITLSEMVERFQRDYLPARNLKKSTMLHYQGDLRRHLVPALGHHLLTELEQHPELIDRYIVLKSAQGLSPKTVGHHLRTLSLVFKVAQRWRLVRTNPCSLIERPRVEEAELQVLTESEIARLLAAYRQLESEATEAERPWWAISRRLVLVALGTAMRRGELLALRWQDVKLLDGLVRVERSYVRNEMTTPKSRASRRTIELGPHTRAAFEEQWEETSYRADSDIVFCHPQLGTPLDASKLSRCYLRPALKRAGIEKPFRPWHDLRHTALTHEAAAGNPQAYIQLKAGHSQGTITERYIHAAQVLFPGAAARAEERMFATKDCFTG